MFAEQRMEKIDYARTLNGHAPKISAPIIQIGLLWTMSIQPGEIFFRARSIHHEQKLLIGYSICNQIVDDPASVVEQKSVLPWPTSNLSMLLVSIVFSQSRAPLPSKINCPMCEISKMPTLFRTA